VFNLLPGTGLGFPDNAGILAFDLGHPFALIVPEEYYALIHLTALETMGNFSIRTLISPVISIDRFESFHAKRVFGRFFCSDGRSRKFVVSPQTGIKAIPRVLQAVSKSNPSEISTKIGFGRIVSWRAHDYKVKSKSKIKAKLRQQ